MDNDTIYKRVNIVKVMNAIKEREPEIEDAHALAVRMIRELEKSVEQMVSDFEEGEGEFSACYYQAIDTN